MLSLHNTFYNFENRIVNFESRIADYKSFSCIQTVTLCPILCLKARLKVL